FQIGLCVDFLELGVGVGHAVELDAVFAKRIFNADAGFVLKAPNFVNFEDSGGGSGAEKTVAKARSFFVCPIDELHCDRMIWGGGVTAHSFERGDDSKRAIKPAAVWNGIDVAADDHGFVGFAA